MSSYKIFNWLQRKTGSSGVCEVAALRGAVASEIGNVRNDNQDKAIVVKGVNAQAREYAIAVVADGIGGMTDGAACAALSIASFTYAITNLSRRSNFSPEVRMVEAANFANEAVYRKYLGRGGSTLVAVMFSAGTPPLWVSAGDSRIYLQSGSLFKLLTTDDTIAGQLNKNGTVTAEQSKILQFVGMGKDLDPNVGNVTEPLQGQLILTTDGVHYLEKSSEWFKSIIQNAPNASATAKRLVEVANWCGGLDNATLACVSFPLRQSERHSASDGIQIWDAFGELDIELQPNRTSIRQPNVDTLDRNTSNVRPAVVEDVNLQVIEDDKLGLLSPTGKTKCQTAPQRSRKNQAKKTHQKNAPQLDIEFSRKE